MKVNTILVSCLLFCSMTAGAQKFLTKTGHIRFYSDSRLEKIEAISKQVNSGVDVSTGDFVFKVPMKSFEFEKALMQEHFNENYVESEKFPSATFLGKVMNIREVNLGKDGLYYVNVAGKLTIHGITKEITAKGTFEVKQGTLVGKSKFNVVLEDFKISIPGAVILNISKEIEVNVDVTLDKANM
ncbi:MAG: YceI family protein [Bacteroidota bacterium]